MKVAAGNGSQTVAQARDNGSAAHMWDLMYDGTQHALTLYAYTATGSNQLTTTVNSVAANTWVQVEVQYTATATGGARALHQRADAGRAGRSPATTRARRTSSGSSSGTTGRSRPTSTRSSLPGARAPPVCRARRRTSPAPPATPPSTSAGRLPSSNGGSPITGYRITPYIGANAQTPVLTGSAGTTFTVTGLTNGTAYTFRVAAINAVGTAGLRSCRRPITPVATVTVPGVPTGLVRSRRRPLRRAELDRAGVRRRQPDHELPDHAVHRRERPDADQHRNGCHELHGQQPDERDCVHLHGRGDERGRDRVAFGGDAAADAGDRLHGTALRRRLRVRRPPRVERTPGNGRLPSWAPQRAWATTDCAW